MGNPFKIMIFGYLFPLFGATVAAFAPEYDPSFIIWIYAVFVILLLMPMVLVFRYPSNKAKAYKLTINYQLYSFCLFIIFPLVKVVKGEIFYQILLVGLFVSLYVLARLDQRTEVPIVFPGNDREHKKVKTWIAYIYYSIPVLVSFFGVGGDYLRIRILFESHGDGVMMPYFSTLIYLFSCWLLFFLSSMAYKSHVKEGYLDK